MDSYELNSADVSESSSRDDHGGDPVLDREGVSASKQCLKDLEKQIQKAEKAGESARVKELKDDVKDIEKQLKDTQGWRGGKPKQLIDDWERTRKKITNAISRAKLKIKSVSPELHRHLKQCLKGGNNFTYTPSALMNWVE